MEKKIQMYLQQAGGSPSLAKIYAAGSITPGQQQANLYKAVTTLQANERSQWPNTQLCFTLSVHK